MATPVNIPDTPVGTTSQWIVDVLNSDEDTVVADWETKLHSSFTAEVSAEELVQLVNQQLRPAHPFTATHYQGDERQAITELSSELSPALDMTVALNDEGQIIGLFFAPASKKDAEQAASMEELKERLEEFPATVHALMAPVEILQTGGEPVLDMSSTEPAPLGSIFKLYVLLALSESIKNGDLTWEDELTITDEVRSLPSGELQDEPNGTIVTVRDAATKMIEISDNTATDMLIQRLGRETVEAAVVASGHHDPDLMQPFPSTRELFQIEWGNPEYLERWTSGTAEERHALLDELSRQPFTIEDLTIGNNALWTKGVEWFASPRDIATVHVALQATGDRVVREILGRNPGVPADSWEYVAYKGGSSPGVLAGSWLTEDADGKQYVVVVQAASEDATAMSVNENELLALWDSALKLAHP
ncbi:MAG: Cpe/LpqF family protein [Ancrocorticia sp.]